MLRELQLLKKSWTNFKHKIYQELGYFEWLANAVMVKKANGKWRMSVDFSNLNKACPMYGFFFFWFYLRETFDNLKHFKIKCNPTTCLFATCLNSEILLISNLFKNLLVFFL